MIKAESITRRYGNVVAVDQVSFQIEHGEIVGLLGHNGAGKTTIMKMLTGYLEPSSGTASVNQLDVETNQLAVQKTVGYLPENCPVYPDMIVLDYLDYAATLRGVAPDKKIDRIRYAIAKTRLQEVARQQISTLSRGYRQRLGVAQAILNSPSILILDEPTNGLDPSQILEMRSLIRELAEKATVLISTHILQEVQAVCGRVIIINKGKLALDASMKDLRKSDRLAVSLDVDRDKADAVVGRIDGVRIESVKSVDQQFHYILETTDGTASDIAPRVAKAFVESGCSLFALQPQIRDLETIFGEITASGGANALSGAVETETNGNSGIEVETAEPADQPVSSEGGSDSE